MSAQKGECAAGGGAVKGQFQFEWPLKTIGLRFFKTVCFRVNYSYLLRKCLLRKNYFLKFKSWNRMAKKGYLCDLGHATVVGLKQLSLNITKTEKSPYYLAENSAK